MSHEVTIRRNGTAEMAYRGETPWHGLGNHLPEGGTIEEWQVAAGMDWQVHRAKVRYATAPDGAAIRTMDDRHVLFRSDTKAPLGIVSKDYRIVQPKEVLEFFRDLTEEAGFVLETAGTLHGGRKYWALARATADVPVLDRDDKVGRFVLLSTTADGTGATDARDTDIRVVCQNTLNAALKGRGKSGVRVTHRTEFDPVAVKRDLGLNVEAVRERFEHQMETFRKLAQTKLTKDEMIRLTLRALGHNPDEMTAREAAEAASRPAAMGIGGMALTGRGLKGSHLRGGHGTAWAWLCAVTQYVDHEARARSRDNRLDSAWFGRGDALKSRAYELAVEQIGGPTVYVTSSTPPEGATENDNGGLLDQVLSQTVTA